ncbi:uncharacterized protein LOC106768775 isoform X2 [Vigna radiata var. radiata]|uniref:Uncharacterized protein LOC106768775 isoform X2 n=1 Tax=Vigna radiata var. radiata TaxID=3916 RepID=A0A3Q0FAQ4_VIGRR|nr:uncharacterized protein LOC106768775 isoform X2 [Vigna radiata var. radiata]
MSSEKEAEARKSSSEEISREFKTLVNSGDLHSLNHMQHTILGRLQDSNAVLSHFNDFSQHCFAEISGDIARNTRILKSVKSDLDYIFQKLRLLLVSEPTQQKDLIIWTLGENTETMSVFEPPVIPRLKDMKGKGVQNS